jgi:hypothetical protein
MIVLKKTFKKEEGKMMKNQALVVIDIQNDITKNYRTFLRMSIK